MKKSMFFLRFLSLEKILLEMLKCFFFSSLVETLDANISEFLNFVEKIEYLKSYTVYNGAWSLPSKWSA